MRVLMSAYSCEPGRGSEPGVGWNMAQEMSKYHDVWVLTRESNRRAIESAVRRQPTPPLRFVYFDFPAWIRWLKRGQLGVQAYYYAWQVGAYFLVRSLNRQVSFDLVHHVTFAKYWMPSFLALSFGPFIWGPVGGGESAPRSFWSGLGFGGRAYEALRELARWVGERDPFVQLTVRRSAVALAKTEQTANRLRKLGAREVRVIPGEGLRATEIEHLARFSSSHARPVRFISMGNLLHLKGFHLGLRAFALANLGDAEYWIAGEGPERKRLEGLAHRLTIARRVRFLGWLPREQALRRLADCDVLVHPGLHESGSWVCAEAMAAGRPVICLDLGGPGAQVTERVGFKIQAGTPQQAINDLAAAMRRLAGDAELRGVMGEAGRQHSRAACWERRGQTVNALYWRAVDGHARESTSVVRHARGAHHAAPRGQA